jgi:hypothetical protein
LGVFVVRKNKSTIKKVTIISIVGLALIALASVAYMQFINPLDIKGVYIWLEPFSDDELRLRQEYYNRYVNNDINGDHQFIRMSDPFPSENDKDYCHVRIFILLENHSIFKVNVNDGFIKNANAAQNVIYKRPIALSTTIEKSSVRLTEDCYELFFWRDGMSDEEVISYMRNLIFEVYYENDLANSLKLTIPLKEVSVVDFDDLDEIRNRNSGN